MIRDGYVANDDKKAAVPGGQHLEKVAAHLLRGQVDGFDCEPGNGIDLLGEDDLLDFTGGCHLALKNPLLAAHAGGAQNDDDGK